MPRLFFALWPDEPTRQELAQIGARLHDRDGRKVPPANYHVTLHFLGGTDPALLPALRDAAGQIRGEPFSLQLEHLGWWRRSRLLWVAPETVPAPLRMLVTHLNRIARDLALPVETRGYRPHVTLARKAMRQPYLPEVQPLRWQADDFCLVESRTRQDGPQYTVIERWPLRAAGASGG